MTELITIKQLSDLWNIPKGQLYKMTMNRQIPYVKLKSGGVRFNPADLDRYVKERTVPAKAVGV